MKKDSSSTFTALISGTGILIASVITVTRYVDVDLSKVNSITGIVAHKEVVNLKEGKKSYHPYLLFRLNNTHQDFIARISGTDALNIESNINKNDTLKVFFRQSSNPRQSVFQIEKGDRILKDYNTYNKSKSGVAVIGLFAGIFLIAYSILKYRKTTIWEMLNRLVK